MSSNSIFSSIESEKRWVLGMNKSFPQDHDTIDMHFDAPTCIFRVPTTLTETKPEAYAPQLIGFGPYHHLRPDIYPTQKQKLAAVREYVEQKKLQSIQELVNALIQMEHVLRACYDQYLDHDIQTLAWIIAVDGLYLLHFLENYVKGEQDSALEKLAGDILMLENQIPVILLSKIQEALVSGCYDPFLKKFDDFSRGCSPLVLNEQFVVLGDTSQLHLLHRMYYLIVNNRGIKDQDPTTRMSVFSMPISFDNVNNAVGFLAERGVPGASTAGQILSFVDKVNWRKVLGLFKKQNSDEENVLVDEIDIPSVSQMSDVAGIKFALTLGGIRDVSFDDRERRFYLPIITLTSTSEIVLRNLVAYEVASAKPGATLEFAEYVDLMCGIIDTVKDVRILRNEGIIVGELPDEEIARIFNGIGKSTRKNEQKSNLEDVIDEVNKRYDNVGRVKVKRFFEKYVYASFKILCVLVTIAVFALVTLNSFCSVFGCGRWFDKSSMLQSAHLLGDH